MATAVTTTARLPARTPTIALALGGGGARGLAHVLMLEVLDELGIRPKIIAGTSIGALYGAAYAAGIPARQIRATTEEVLGTRYDLIRQLFAARSTPVQRFLSLLPLRSALLNPEAVVELVLPSRMPKDFKSLATPLRVVATDLGSRTAVVIQDGPLLPAIAASIAIPVIFQPVVLGGRTLVDGGLVNPLPYDLIDGEADVTVAIDVSGAASETDVGPTPSAMEVLVSSITIMEKSITRERLRYRKPDIYIDVNLDKFHALEFYKPKELLAAAEPAKARLKSQLERLMASETIPEQVPEAAEQPSRRARTGRRRLFRRKERA